MAGKHKHIEGLYQDAFANHRAEPPKSAWKSMQHNLDNVRLEQLAKSRLADTAIEPSASAWFRIASHIGWQNFLHFNPLQFNVYYAGLALLGGSAAIVGINLNQNQAEMQSRDMQPDIVIESMSAPHAKSGNNDLKLSERDQTADFMQKRNAMATENVSSNNDVTASAANDKARDIVANFDENASAEKEITDLPVPENKQTNAQKMVIMPAGISHFAPWEFESTLKIKPEFAYRPDTLGFDYKNDPIVKDLNFIEEGWYAGVVMLKQDMTFMNNEIREVYQQNEKISDFSYRIGLRLNIVRNQFMMQTGLYFASINNTFEHNQEIAIIEDDIEGRVIWPYQSDTVYHNTTHKYHNTYRYVELPLLAGLHLEGRRFATNIKTGPVFNYLTGVNADLVLSSDNTLKSLDKSYFKKPGLRWQVSVDLIYRFGDRLSFYIEPSYVHDLTNAFNQDVEMESRLKGVNVGLGLYYRF
jgi:hypothetical protein